MSRGLAKLENIVAETLLRAQMFPSLATHETLLRMLQGRKCSIRSTFPRLATEETSQATMFQQQCFLV